MARTTFRHAVIDFFDRNPTEELLIEDAAIKFGITKQRASDKLLEMERNGELSARFEKRDDESQAVIKVYTHKQREQEAA